MSEGVPTLKLRLAGGFLPGDNCNDIAEAIVEMVNLMPLPGGDLPALRVLSASWGTPEEHLPLAHESSL